MDKFVNQINIAEGHDKGFEEGLSKGHSEEKLEIAKNCLKKDMSIGDIVEIAGLTEEEINSLKD